MCSILTYNDMCLKYDLLFPQDHHNQFPRDLSACYKKVRVNFFKITKSDYFILFLPSLHQPFLQFHVFKGLTLLSSKAHFDQQGTTEYCYAYQGNLKPFALLLSQGGTLVSVLSLEHNKTTHAL